MISQSMVELIEKNADALAKQWLKDVRTNANTPFYHTFNEDYLFERARNMYKNLGHWLNVATPKQETAKFYRKIRAGTVSRGVSPPRASFTPLSCSAATSGSSSCTWAFSTAPTNFCGPWN